MDLMIDLAKLTTFDITIVIPALNAEDYLPVLLKSIETQTLLPKEIVIVDSSSTNKTAEVVGKWEGAIPINYKKVDFAYPGHARNIGVELAQTKWIAFLDSRTLPEKDWLESCAYAAYEGNAEFVVASRISEADTHFKQLLRAATYGCSAHASLAGSLVLKDVFERSKGFIPGVRAGEDIEWINRIISLGLKMEYADKPLIRYYGLPNSLGTTVKKYYKYSISAARVDVFSNHKNIYLSVFLILSALLVYRWNGFFANGDENNPFFIPHIMKIYLVTSLFLYVIFRGIIRPTNLNYNLTLFEKVYLLVLIILTTGLIYKWNAIFAKWDVNSFLYIPHITKIYIVSLFILSIIFRGIIRPLKRKVNLSFLFPWRWLVVGLVGLCLDIVKTPGYVWGAILELMGKSIRKSPFIK